MCVVVVVTLYNNKAKTLPAACHTYINLGRGGRPPPFGLVSGSSPPFCPLTKLIENAIKLKYKAPPLKFSEKEPLLALTQINVCLSI